MVLSAVAELLLLVASGVLPAAQVVVVQTSKVTLPVSWLSGSLKVAVRVGVVVFRRAASAGETSAGVEGGRSEERCVGEGGRSRWAPDHLKKKSSVAGTNGSLPSQEDRWPS